MRHLNVSAGRNWQALTQRFDIQSNTAYEESGPQITSGFARSTQILKDIQLLFTNGGVQTPSKFKPSAKFSQKSLYLP